MAEEAGDTVMVAEPDFTEGLPNRVVIPYCPECSRVLRRTSWSKAPKDLMNVCLDNLRLSPGMNVVKIIKGEFVATVPPDMKRITIEVVVEKKINEVDTEKAYIVEFTMIRQICPSCIMTESFGQVVRVKVRNSIVKQLGTRLRASTVSTTPRALNLGEAVVQVRQDVHHRRTLIHLQQIVHLRNAAARAIRTTQMDNGVDYYFANKGPALVFVDILANSAPVKISVDKRKNSKGSSYYYKFTVQISPICREDLIYLPSEVAISLGNLGPLVICTKVTKKIALLDPFTLKSCDMDSAHYWNASFGSLLCSRQLVEYVVSEIHVVSDSEVKNMGGVDYALARGRVVRVSDGKKLSAATHLGNLFNSGDCALGYDLYGFKKKYNDESQKYIDFVGTDVLLINRRHKPKGQKKRGRPEDSMDSEYKQFLRDLEEKPELMFNISLDPDKECKRSEVSSSARAGENVDDLSVEDLLGDLDLSDREDSEGKRKKMQRMRDG
ncbi:hypothetical protein RJ640_019922 [Escallonia rubra]|uniref:60S ribosomal export protein NMD3 n=1 Tax=Escallonia rubra TaxID=112253 RepID=A0AA88QAA3_9ASTE|nr:hypothetical protein RJ640_019922 [Escallonia rubra]